MLAIELWGRLVSLVSQVPSDYSNVYGPSRAVGSLKDPVGRSRIRTPLRFNV
jgi:hypothetical protein